MVSNALFLYAGARLVNSSNAQRDDISWCLLFFPEGNNAVFYAPAFYERSFSLSGEIVSTHRGGLLLGTGGELLRREVEELSQI